MPVHRLLPLLWILIVSQCHGAPQAARRSTPVQCPPTALPCDDGVNCVERAQWCDGMEDCVDESDEAYCETKSWFNKKPNLCSERHFLCGNGVCFPATARCDGTTDCEDGDDEANCKVDADSELVHSSPVAKNKDNEFQGPIEVEHGSEEDDSNQVEPNHADPNPDVEEDKTKQFTTQIPCTEAPSTPCPQLQTLCSQLQSLCGQMLVQWPCTPPSPCPQTGTQPCIAGPNPCPQTGAQPCIAGPNPCPQTGTQPCIAGPTPCPKTGTQPCIAKPNPCPQTGTQPCIAGPTPCTNTGGHDPPCVPGHKSGSGGKNKKSCPQEPRSGIKDPSAQNPPKPPCPTVPAKCPNAESPPCPTAPAKCPNAESPPCPTALAKCPNAESPPCPTAPAKCPSEESIPSSTTPCGGPTPTPDVPETTTTTKPSLRPIISTPRPTPRPCDVGKPATPKATDKPQCPHAKDPGPKSPNPCQSPGNNPNPCANPCTDPCAPAPEPNPCANPCPDPEPAVCPTPPDPCGHLTGRNFNFPEEQYAEFQFEHAEQLMKGQDWLRGSMSDYSDWGEDTPRAVVALSLLDPRLFSNFNAVEVGLMKKALQINLAMEMSSKKTFGMERLSQYLNALLATNQNPRDFEGTDLVARLQGMVDETLRGGQQPVHPFVALSLCLAGAVEPSHAAAHHVIEWLQSPSAPLHHMHQDMHSYAIMALACYGTEPRLDAKYRKLLEEATQRLIARIGIDGSFGSKYSTAIAAQALLSVKTHGSWDVAKTLNFLLDHQLDETGSFGNMLATYYALPAIAGKSLLHLLNTVCSTDTPEPDTVPPPTTTTTTTPEPEIDHTIRLSLYVGNNAKAFSTIELVIPKGTNLLDAMKMAESRDSDFRFRYERVDGKAMVYAISGYPNDAERRHYWQLFVETPPRNERRSVTEQDILDTGGIEQMFPADGEHIIFWYKRN